jgi:hypothetical protein
MIKLRDGWQMMVWYAPLAGSDVIRIKNKGFGYLASKHKGKKIVASRHDMSRVEAAGFVSAEAADV